ncbi:ImmA/IrrE family metallo-endopeptidase [Burkholderia cepacia]|uniref:ImmA/IrrE family metallo-endopeptidase n=1 Tax=Burkholderia cepacia TaxID=292 RepID=A0A8I1DLU3_BURCE|nr:ImmA/IrrE family metallo-endopeptidase [Burkholderia cepacia]MBA9900919.1 ImmA/IrrE family metallo-endopeptidase [Burkholderia cepacia]MBA9947885.1 ImmA/IrrE family metallo-endopeptidase [Burkholderia cepacia]MBA9978131.1 ImmA/IrrE family metallo-endopeptidase [Burkholderia cepacia]MBA9996934.1 ImmA/IrrE family metallo-endopeptidase [Burkholderia cepacia]MBB0004695.1 ImmA/IrrE family metallo-endopeptidase [Burkholderia cepacia]
MSDKKALFTAAVAKALQARKRLGIALEEAVSPLDAAEKLGVEVRLADLPSMEGMYVSGGRPTIILSSLRPFGRRNFTCAHELGHHAFGHGEQFDELTSDRSYRRATDSKEFQADTFAAFFLMPKSALENGMLRRQLKYDTLDPIAVYGLANWLGVGYSTLVNHMVNGIGTISRAIGDRLLRSAPRDIRQQLIGTPSAAQQVILADQHWRGRSIDCEVGDLIRVPENCRYEGALAASPIVGFAQVQAVGISRIVHEEAGWSAFVRASLKNYKGRACFRFEEEVDE